MSQLHHQPCRIPKAVLITGACGFIGSNFLNYIFDKWFINFDKLAFGASEENVEAGIRSNGDRYRLIKDTLRRREAVVDCLRENEIDTVIHFAAVTHVDESYTDRIGTIAENVLSMTTLLEAIVHDYDHRLQRFVHISTDEVYGDSAEGSVPKSETSLMNPTNPYAASKAACEVILNSYHHSYKLPAITVRMNNVYGPRQAYTKLIPKFTSLALQGKPYPLMGDGQHTRSWMYVDDCSEAIRRVTESGTIAETYNIGIEFEKSNLQLTLMIHEIVGKLCQREHSQPSYVSVPDRPYHDRRYHIDFSKINRSLGWSCATPFEDGLRQTIAYYLNEHLAKKNSDTAMEENISSRVHG